MGSVHVVTNWACTEYRPLPPNEYCLGMDEQVTVFEAVGGEVFFVSMIDRFFDLVESDPVVRRLYPEDLGESRRRTAAFLCQLWGGPPDYSIERGHPRLRMRHMPFEIGQAERDAWLGHMLTAVREKGLAPELEEAMVNYFETASTHMINQPE